jgi:hypothetical protein
MRFSYSSSHARYLHKQRMNSQSFRDLDCVFGTKFVACQKQISTQGRLKIATCTGHRKDGTGMCLLSSRKLSEQQPTQHLEWHMWNRCTNVATSDIDRTKQGRIDFDCSV